MKRTEISQEYKWKIEDLYATNEVWEEDFAKLQKGIEELKNFEGTLGQSAENLLKMQEKCDELNQLAEKVYVYANQRLHEDMGDTLYQGLSGRAQMLLVQMSEAASYIEPEILAIAEEKLEEMMNIYSNTNILFIGGAFLEENSELKPNKGDIVNKKGEVLGKHNGLYNYTIGQRKGLGISYKEPLYVIGFNSEKNQLIVGTNQDTYKNEMLVNNINWLLIDKLNEKKQVAVKTRYSAKEYKATIEQIEDDLVKVIFEKPAQRITPGQSAVFYLDDVVLGGGKIL